MPIKLDSRNARKHSDRNKAAIRKSLETVGAGRSILLDADDTVIAGNGVAAEWEAMGKPVRVIEATGDELIAVKRTDLSGDKARQAATLDNLAADTSAFEYDEERLREALENDPVSKAIADSRDELRALLKQPPKAEAVDAGELVDRAAQLQEKWQVQRGDLWQCGKHRILCGDSTNADDVARVNEQKAQLLFTSPPYAAQREYEIGAFDWDALMDGVFIIAQSIMNDDGAIIVNLGLVHKDGRVNRYYDSWLDRMDKTEWVLFGWYVWDKINGLMGDWRGRLAPAHEWIFHFAKNPRRANKTESTQYAERGITHYKVDKVGLRNKDGSLKGFTQAGQEVSQTKIPDSVIRVQPARGGVDGHPAPFSVDFAKKLIEAYSNENEFVYDPFLGSGTTLVACEQTGRIGRGIEIEPRYVAVALERLSALGLECKRIASAEQ